METVQYMCIGGWPVSEADGQAGQAVVSIFSLLAPEPYYLSSTATAGVVYLSNPSLQPAW